MPEWIRYPMKKALIQCEAAQPPGESVRGGERQHGEWQIEERLRVGDTWQDRDLVFPNQVGGPMYAQNFLACSYFPCAGAPAHPTSDLPRSAALSGHVPCWAAASTPKW